MYIRLLSFQTKGNRKEEVVSIMESIMPKIKSQPGCKDIKFLTRESENHYALVVFWNSEAEADAAAKVIAPQLIPALNKIATEEVVHRLYEVYQPAPVTN